jgi:CRP/FNR family cyclic AMP-dependent transcriptional regulator
MSDDVHQTALSSSLWPRSSLLARLTASDREELLRLGTRATYPSQQVLIRHGDPEDYAVLLTKGFTKVVVDTENGYEALLAIRVGGDLVGEMATLERKPRAATVISCASSTRPSTRKSTFRSYRSASKTGSGGSTTISASAAPSGKPMS